MAKVTMKSEAMILREVQAALGAEPDLLLLRNQVGLHKETDEETGAQRRMSYGLGTGSPDLVAILRTPGGVGVWICFETKSETGRVSPEQRKCHEIWSAFGAFVFVVRSAGEALGCLARVRSCVRQLTKPAL